jgi:hypothetical protein
MVNGVSPQLAGSGAGARVFWAVDVSSIENMIHFPITIRKNRHHVNKTDFSFHALIHSIQ